MSDSFYYIITIIGVTSYFIPATIVLIKNIWRQRPFLFFSIYWLIGGLINLTDFIPGINSRQQEIIAVLYNVMDFPLILAILYYTSDKPALKKFILCSGILLILMEIFFIASGGIYYTSIRYIIGIGLILVISVLVSNIIAHIQKIHHSNTEYALIFIHAALLFTYGTFIVIYIFDYFMEESSTRDNYLIYYLSTFIGILVALYGFLNVKPAVMEKKYAAVNRKSADHSKIA